MDETFFFYDLETSGLKPREDRIMQFAGQRTDKDLNAIGDPINLLVKLDDDTLPSPDAIMVTKITPQQTRLDGLSEREFCAYVQTEIFTPDTIAVGYNSVRFDDEFMRFTFWRNFYDPYEWQWKDGRSRWDLLDVVRMTRALRPEGIKWPFQPVQRKNPETGKLEPVLDDAGAPIMTATNRLELITKLNGIEHQHAHDALSDVEALISVTRLIRDKQPKLYAYLLNMRNKKYVSKLVNLDHPAPFVYSCGEYPSKFNKTSVAYPICPSKNGNIIVYDLRYDVEDLIGEESLRSFAEPDGAWQRESERRAPVATGGANASPERVRTFFPMVKEFALNKCPAVAPLGVLEADDGWQKIGLSRSQVEKNLASLKSHPELIQHIAEALEKQFDAPADADAALYDGFLADSDRLRVETIRNADVAKLANFHPSFTDPRLPELLLHYKGRNFPDTLTESETETWASYRHARLNRQASAFTESLKNLQSLSARDQKTARGDEIDPYLLEELALWYQSLV